MAHWPPATPTSSPWQLATSPSSVHAHSSDDEKRVRATARHQRRANGRNERSTQQPAVGDRGLQGWDAEDSNLRHPVRRTWSESPLSSPGRRTPSLLGASGPPGHPWPTLPESGGSQGLDAHRHRDAPGARSVRARRYRHHLPPGRGKHAPRSTTPANKPRLEMIRTSGNHRGRKNLPWSTRCRGRFGMSLRPRRSPWSTQRCSSPCRPGVAGASPGTGQCGCRWAGHPCGMEGSGRQDHHSCRNSGDQHRDQRQPNRLFSNQVAPDDRGTEHPQVRADRGATEQREMRQPPATRHCAAGSVRQYGGSRSGNIGKWRRSRVHNTASWSSAVAAMMWSTGSTPGCEGR